MTALLSEAVLREMAWTDIPALAELEREIFGAEAWTEPIWWAELAQRPRRSYLVAERDGQVVAYAGLDVSGDTADVMTVAVAPAGRGAGLGRRLLDRLVDLATAAGAQALLLEVRADNATARRMYATGGFEEIHVRPRYYQPDDVDAVIMRRHLAPSAAGATVGADGPAAAAGDGGAPRG